MGVQKDGFFGESMSGVASDHCIVSKLEFGWDPLEAELSEVHLVEERVEADKLGLDLECLQGLGFDDLSMDLLERFGACDPLEENGWRGWW